MEIKYMNIIEAINYLKLDTRNKVIVSNYEYSTIRGDIYVENINYRIGENPEKVTLVKVTNFPIEHVLSINWEKKNG